MKLEHLGLITDEEINHFSGSELEADDYEEMSSLGAGAAGGAAGAASAAGGAAAANH